MPSLSATLNALGNDGAVANARRALDVQDHEAWLVASLASRLEQRALAVSAEALAVPATNTSAA